MMHIPESSRLSFRLMGQNDEQALWQLDQDPDVMRYINGGKIHSMKTIQTVFLPRLKAYTNAEKGWGLWQVNDKKTHEYLGWVLVRPMDFFAECANEKDLELGWRFFKKAWGKGYATEAATAICDVLKTQTNIDYLSALAVKNNLPSIKVMKKIGMHFISESVLKDPLGDLDVVHYQMTTK